MFLFILVSRPVLGPTQPPIQWVPRALSPRLKRQRRDANRTPLSSAKVRNGGAIPPLPHIMVECFPGIRTEKLHKVIEKRDLSSPETVIIHVGTNDL
jgi:hypothetical protein